MHLDCEAAVMLDHLAATAAHSLDVVQRDGLLLAVPCQLTRHVRGYILQVSCLCLLRRGHRSSAIVCSLMAAL